MRSSILPVTLAAAAAVVAGSCFAPTADAARLDVEFTGMDLYYGFDGSTNLQSGPRAGNEDALDAATFYVDDANLGTLVGNLSSNIGIAGLNNIPASGGTRSNLYAGGYFRVNFDTASLSSGLLNLGVDAASKVDITYVDQRLQIVVTGSSTDLYTQQPIDRLPAWPGFDPQQTVRFSFSSSNLTDLAYRDNKLVQFHARGSGTIAQQTAAVPEPASLAVLGLGGVALLRRRAN